MCGAGWQLLLVIVKARAFVCSLVGPAGAERVLCAVVHSASLLALWFVQNRLRTGRLRAVALLAVCSVFDVVFYACCEPLGSHVCIGLLQAVLVLVCVCQDQRSLSVKASAWKV